jgi:hypothetical protein
MKIVLNTTNGKFERKSLADVVSLRNSCQICQSQAEQLNRNKYSIPHMRGTD